MKRLFTLPFPLIAMLFSIACQSNPKPLKAVRTVIAGEVVNTDENSATTIRVNLCDPLEDFSSPTVQLGKTGWIFHIEHDYLFGQNLTVYYHNQFINLYVEPGDSIFIRIDAKELAANRPLDQAVQFSGDRAEVSRQIMNWCNYSYAKLPYPEFQSDMNSEQIQATLYANLNLRRDSLDAYASRNLMDKFVYDWAEMDAKFLIANSLDQITEDLKILKDPVFDIQNPDNFRSMMFRYHVSYVSSAAVAVAKNGEKSQSELAREWIRIIAGEFEGVVKDFAIYKTISQFKDDLPLLYDSLVDEKNLFSEKVFEEKLHSLIRTEEESIIGSSVDDMLYYDGKEGKAEKIPSLPILSYLAQRYPGKVLYIDVWFTTCGPCRGAIIDHAPALHDYYEGNDVVFVNLCVRSTPEQWTRAIKEFPVHGENYLLDSETGDVFADEYKIAGYPTYMLVDREGNLISNKAPQPSDLSRTIKEIDKLL